MKRLRKVQEALANCIGTASYRGHPIISLQSHPDVALSETFWLQYRADARRILDGAEGDVPLTVRTEVVCALQYQRYHSIAGAYDFQLRRNECRRTLGHLCGEKETDYTFSPPFATSSALNIDDAAIPDFLDDDAVGPQCCVTCHSSLQ